MKKQGGRGEKKKKKEKEGEREIEKFEYAGNESKDYRSKSLQARKKQANAFTRAGAATSEEKAASNKIE